MGLARARSGAGGDEKMNEAVVECGCMHERLTQALKREATNIDIE